MVATAICATLGVASLCWGGIGKWETYPSLWMNWWVGDLMGALVVAPVLLVWHPPLGPRRSARQLQEAALILLPLVMTGLLVFGGPPGWPGVTHPLFFVFLPFILLAAVRLEERGAALATLVLCTLAIWGTLQGAGPFAAATTKTPLWLLPVFMGVTSLIGLLLAANVTERRRAEAALRAKSEELDRYFTDSLDLLCIADTDGHFRRLNPEWERTLGYPLAELEGQRFLDFVHPDDVEATLAALGQLASHEHVLNFVNRYRHQDGSYRWIEWRSYPEDHRIYAVARDITKHKRAEEAFQETRGLLNEVGRIARIGGWKMDLITRKATWTLRASSRYDFCCGWGR